MIQPDRMMPFRKLGLIAGNGKFPLIFGKQARDIGISIVAVAHRGETPKSIEDLVDSLTWIRIGQLGKIIRTFHRAGIKEAVMAGGIQKIKLFSNFVPDIRGAAFLARIRSMDDDNLLRGIAEELEGEGIKILKSTLFLQHIIPSEGILTTKSPTKKQWEDINLGFRVAKDIGRLGIGQSVVVKDQIVLSVEAIEGTDAAILRCGIFGRGGLVVVKTSKPEQDLRFDVPAVGVDTIGVMKKAGGEVLAVEADKTVLIEKEELLQKADAAGISIVAVTPR